MFAVIFATIVVAILSFKNKKKPILEFALRCVIPLGSRVWVEGYDEAISGDTGGAIKGNIIDVFLEHKQDALNWDRKTVTIKILD